MTWRRRTGSVTSRQAARVSGILSRAGVISLIESDDHNPDSVQVAIAVDRDDRVAVATGAEDHPISAGPALVDLAQEIAQEVSGDVVFWGIHSSPESDVKRGRRVDPFEQPLGADIALFVDRTVVVTRGGHHAVVELATQVEDTVYARVHLDGYLVCITEGPIMTSIDWSADTLPVVIVEQGSGDPLLTVIPQEEERSPAAGEHVDQVPEGKGLGHTDAHVFTWDAQVSAVPAGADLPSDAAEAVAAFADVTLGTGALVQHIMRALPAVEPVALRAALDGQGAGLLALVAALDLPVDLMGYLDGDTEAEELAGVVAVHPDTFVENVRRVMSEASFTMSETTEAMRARAVAVRVRTETAFDAAETFAEEVVIPARRSWVSPALAAAETTLGVLALRKARRVGGLAGGALGTGGVLLLADAVVNTVITLAPVLRRQR